MKKILFFLFIFILMSCNNHERNCNDFKTGKFEFVQVVNGKKEVSIFIRTDKIQIETYKKKTDTATVRWVNDCEFILQKLHPKNRK